MKKSGLNWEHCYVAQDLTLWQGVGNGINALLGWLMEA